MSRASELEMLLLVLTDRHMRRMVEQNVGRHQIGVDAEPDGRPLLVLAGLLLELRHPLEPAQPGDAIEDPGKLGMLADLALIEDDAALRVDAAGDIGGGDVADRPVELLRISHRDRMHVDHAIDAFMRVLQPDPVEHRAEVVAEMEIPVGCMPEKTRAVGFMADAYAGKALRSQAPLCRTAQGNASATGSGHHRLSIALSSPTVIALKRWPSAK